MNSNSWQAPSPVPQPIHTVTPVVISVQLPDGSHVQSNVDGTHIVASPAGMNTTFPPEQTSPTYAVVKKQSTSEQISYANNKVQAHKKVSPPYTAAVPPPPAPPPPVAPPPPTVLPKPQSIVVPREANCKLLYNF